MLIYPNINYIWHNNNRAKSFFWYIKHNYGHNPLKTAQYQKDSS